MKVALTGPIRDALGGLASIEIEADTIRELMQRLEDRYPALAPLLDAGIGELFIAGFGPGFLIGAALMAFVWVWCRIRGYGKRDAEGRQPLGLATRRAGLALMMPVIILGGIYGGIFTPTEASIVA